MLWSSCPHHPRSFDVVSTQESLSKNKFSYWTAGPQWTRFLILLDGNFVYPANNLKEAAKMLMEALAPSSHVTVGSFKTGCKPPCLWWRLPSLWEGSARAARNIRNPRSACHGAFCVTRAQLVSTYLSASKSSRRANAIQQHTVLRRNLGFLAHPQPCERSGGAGTQQLWSWGPSLRTAPKEGQTYPLILMRHQAVPENFAE